ncbi:hypothetical protein ACOIPX_004710 [Salmonella enterica]|uniref:Uncharacterized protein n=1 Tax=Salmonella enterica TaxID=28901 RepID=A0A750HQY1_SALER|nr:hypothetical protein [Salmonella enterica subsp. enterica serovar Muenchen]EBU8673097.1 hypothetical protein [Salmonella enterica subsp. enterica serovar Panama]EDW0700667.1 hypothetical protein [Salmonella enterica subsp. enterica]EEP1779630.1 hypothetical protein [Salmonella enterica]EHG9469370.1 hypothetical protein [Salmonella enterica subsp. enterica serovar Newport]
MGKLKGKLKQRDIDSSKTVGVSQQDEARLVDNSPPTFSFRYLQRGYCIDSCERHEKAALADTLFRLSRLSWAQIRQAPRHGLGYEKVARNAIRAAVPAHITEDVDLIAFRFCGRAPMVGYKLGGTFYIVWLDRVYTLYPH